MDRPPTYRFVGTCRPRRPVRRAARQRPQAGFTLVELLVGLAVAAFVVLVAGSQLVAQLRDMRDLVARLQLNHETRVALQHMARQLRGAGGRPGEPGATEPVSSGPGWIQFIRPNPGAESFGFRLAGGVLQARLGSRGTWQAMTDARTLEITELDFDIQAQRAALSGLCPHDCNGTAPTCMPERNSREVTITLAARHRHVPALVRTLQQSVRLRNDTLEATCVMP